MQVSFNDAPLDTPLWAVYGPDSFPTAVCVKIRNHPTGRAVWGYSVYRRSPGFRTLGQNEEYTIQNNYRFFTEQAEMLAYLGKLLTPHPKACK